MKNKEKKEQSKSADFGHDTHIYVNSICFTIIFIWHIPL